jgi:plasmid stabilization system protein ParE
MSGYKLAPPAQEDLASIRDYYQREAGYRILRRMLAEFVEAFRLIARTPSIGHKREDLAEKRPILFWPVRDYLIVYRVTTDPVEIVTIARGSRDVATIIQRRDL